MTRSEVGRTSRTASRQAYAPPVGRSSGMPSTQPAAGRIAVRIDRTLVRVGLRALVVAGFAGAAWLLSANAAQAADAPVVDQTAGSSVVRLLPIPGADEAPPNGAVSTTLLPSLTHAVSPARQPALGGTTAILAGAVAPEGSATSIGLPGGLLRAGNLDSGHATGHPQDAAGATVAGIIAPVVTPLDSVLRPLPVVPRTGANAGGLASVLPAPVALPAWPSADEGSAPVDGGGFRSTPVMPRVPSQSVLPVAHGVPARDGLRAEAVTAAPVMEHRSVTAAERADWWGATSMDQRRAGVDPWRVGFPNTWNGTGDMPVRPVTAPPGGWAGSGGSTGTSGVPAEGGSCGSALTPVSGSEAASGRLPAVATVEVLRLDTEAPTVSPD